MVTVSVFLTIIFRKISVQNYTPCLKRPQLTVGLLNVSDFEQRGVQLTYRFVIPKSHIGLHDAHSPRLE